MFMKIFGSKYPHLLPPHSCLISPPSSIAGVLAEVAVGPLRPRCSAPDRPPRAPRRLLRPRCHAAPLLAAGARRAWQHRAASAPSWPPVQTRAPAPPVQTRTIVARLELPSRLGPRPSCRSVRPRVDIRGGEAKGGEPTAKGEGEGRGAGGGGSRGGEGSRRHQEQGREGKPTTWEQWREGEPARARAQGVVPAPALGRRQVACGLRVSG